MGEFEIFGRRIKRGAFLMSEKHSSASKSKLLGTVLLILALFGFFVFIYRLCCYHYEYDPQYSPVDYGKYNILSYFTVQSNFFAYVYFLCAALSIFGVKKAEKIGFNPYKIKTCLMNLSDSLPPADFLFSYICKNTWHELLLSAGGTYVPPMSGTVPRCTACIR